MGQEEAGNSAVATDQGRIDLVGLLDITVVADLEERIDAALKGSPDLVIELKSVERVDAAALQLLHFAAVECRRLGGTLKVTGQSPAFDEGLRLLGLEHSIVRG